MKRLSFTTETEWHEIRSQHIGGSDIASLFNAFQMPNGNVQYAHLFATPPADGTFIGCCSPYKTGVRLWHEKKGNLEPEPFDNPRIQAGTFMEPGIAAWAQHRTGWDIRKVEDYLVHDSVIGMGASLDYEVLDHPSGHAAMDCKLVNWDVWKDNWKDTDQPEPPLSIILQLHHQMACSELPHSLAAAYVAGNDLHLPEVARNESIITMCEEAVVAFWWGIGKNQEPDMSYDFSVAHDLFANGDEAILLDCRNDQELWTTVVKWESANTNYHYYKRERDHLKGQILSTIQEAQEVKLADSLTLLAPTRRRHNMDGTFSTYRHLTLKEDIQ